MAETSVPKALEGLTLSKTKELKGVCVWLISYGIRIIAD